MEIERLALRLRPREPWEAMDLGAVMLRAWWRRIWPAWLAVYGGAALILALALPNRPTLVVLLLWWLKPLFDRAVLHVLGGAVFGAAPALGTALRTLPRALLPGALASVTLYRFDLARSFNLPVWHLERLTGRAARARARALHRRARGHAVWLTVACLHFEAVMVLSLYGLFDLLTPGAYDLDIGLGTLFTGAAETAAWKQWVGNLFYVIAVSVIEPFYVAAGFSLYLNRRTQLEAWDIELELRRLASRATSMRAPAAALAAAFALVCASLIAAPTVDAAETAARSPREVIQEVLKEPAFSEYRDVRRLRYTGRGLGLDADREDRPRLGPGWENFGELMAEILRALLWIVVAIAAAAGFYCAARHVRVWDRRGHTAAPAPEALFGFDIRPQSLPADVRAAALSLVEQGRVRGALSLLYRGALSTVVHRDRITLAPGDTEGDCLRVVSAHCAADTARYFSRLVRHWQRTAYGGELPDELVVRTLCDEWLPCFGARERA